MAVSESRYAATWWIRLDDGRIRRDVCPRACALHEGQTGLCFVRMGAGNQIVLTTSSSGFCVDPIEKKPVDHFLPGTSVLSFGTAGCNLACRFCQNRDMSKSREMDTLADAASPGQIAEAASRLRAETVGRRDVALHADDGVQLEQRHRRRGILEIHLALLTVICSTSRRKGTGVDLQPDRKRGLGADTGGRGHRAWRPRSLGTAGGCPRRPRYRRCRSDRYSTPTGSDDPLCPRCLDLPSHSVCPSGQR